MTAAEAVDAIAKSFIDNAPAYVGAANRTDLKYALFVFRNEVRQIIRKLDAPDRQ